MKHTILIFLCLLLTLCLLTACTPDKKTEETEALPSPSAWKPEESNVSSSQNQGQTPDGTTPADVPQNPAESESEQAPVTTASGGMEIVDEYTEMIGDNVGVGGAG